MFLQNLSVGLYKNEMSDNVLPSVQNLYDLPCQHNNLQENIELSESQFNTCTGANKIDQMEQKLLENDDS